MSKDENTQSVDLQGFVKAQAALKGTTITGIAEKIGKSQSTLSGILIRKTMSVHDLIDVLGAMDEDLVIELKNGNKFNIKL